MSNDSAGQATIAVPVAKLGPFVPLWGLVADGLVIGALILTIIGGSRY